jgi:hypothetical protein
MQISLEELQQWFYSSFLSNSNLQREEFKQKISNYMAQNLDKMIQQMCEIVKTSSLTSSLRQVVLTALVQHTGVKKEGERRFGIWSQLALVTQQILYSTAFEVLLI